MVLQAFVDESYDDSFFVMAGYVAHAPKWVQFSGEWETLLPQGVLSKSGTHQFKMNEMAKTAERRARVPLFYEVIEKYAELAISVQFRLEDLRAALRRISVPGYRIDWTRWNNPYFFAFRGLTDIMNQRRDLLGPALKDEEIVDFIFDNNSGKGRIIKAWDVIRDSLPPDVARLYSKTPRFEDDEEFLPLQAADFWAWWVRTWAKEKNSADVREGTFPWPADPETPPKLFVSYDAEGCIAYLSSIIENRLPAGKSIVILPASS